MTKGPRLFLLVISLIQLFFAVAFYFQWPFAVSLWPFPGTTPLTFIFVASIFAAAAASTLWPLLSGNTGALAGVGLDYLTILAPVAVYSFLLGLRGEGDQLTLYGLICLAGAFFGLGLFLWAVRIPFRDPRPLPGTLRAIFVFFVFALIIVGGRLVLQIPNSIPWSITPQLSVVMGWMFLGAMVYFIYALIRPAWANAAGQLAGFLAYDLVLLVPFLTRLPTVASEQRLGLTIYTTVVIFSALVAIYYLFLNPRTRLGGSAPPAPNLRPSL
jgi:hypothetical protein